MVKETDVLKFGFLTSFVSYLSVINWFSDATLGNKLWASFALALVVSILTFVVIEICEGVEKGVRKILDEDEDVAI